MQPTRFWITSAIVMVLMFCLGWAIALMHALPAPPAEYFTEYPSHFGVQRISKPVSVILSSRVMEIHQYFYLLPLALLITHGGWRVMTGILAGYLAAMLLIPELQTYHFVRHPVVVFSGTVLGTGLGATLLTLVHSRSSRTNQVVALAVQAIAALQAGVISYGIWLLRTPS